jgi:LysM repeat protein
LGLALYFDVSLESLLQLNGQTDSDYIQKDTEILVPNPTYTPTPAATALPTFEVLQDVDPNQCRDHKIAAGETLVGIAIKYDVSVQLIQSVNNITNPDLVREGQKLCIPLVTPGPAPSPTFGPTPTSAVAPQHSAPQLLYPPAGVEVPAGTRQVILQWTVAGFLASDEYYMVEIRNLGRPDSRAVRGFVKTTLWRSPEIIRPATGSIEVFAWRVSVVQGVGKPDDPSFRWERSGLPSGWQTFVWMGVAQAVAPTPTSET